MSLPFWVRYQTTSGKNEKTSADMPGIHHTQPRLARLAWIGSQTGVGNVLLAARGDVLGVRELEDMAGELPRLRVGGVDGDQDLAALDLALVQLGLVLGDAEADQRAAAAAHGRAARDAAERGHDGAGGDERPEPRDGDRADPGQPAEGAAQ